MFKAAYDDAGAADAVLARKHEWLAIDHSISMLAAAAAKGPRSRESVEALLYVRRLWCFLIEDLGSPGNGLPQQLRASLISIGLWILSEEEKIRQGLSANYAGLIEISTMIRDGITC